MLSGSGEKMMLMNAKKLFRQHHTIMDKVAFRISNNLLKVIKKCTVSPSTQIIPLRYITSVECFNSNPPRIIVQYNTMNPYNRTEIEYSTFEKAQDDFNKLVKELGELRA